MPDFVVHIGPHKTGSTFLQSTFAALAEPLRAQGILYPADQGEPGHLLIARKLRARDQHAELQAEIDAYIATGCRTVLISAEGLVTLPSRMIAAFRRMLDPHPVRIVFYVRSAADIVVSSWGEQVKHGSRQTLDALVKATTTAPRAAVQVNFGLVLQNWAEVFGKSALSLVSLESLGAEKRDTVAHFAETFLGLPNLPSRDGVKIMSNPAFPLVDAELIRALNVLRHEATDLSDSVMRRRYRKQQKTLELGLATAAAAAAQASIAFDERTPALAAVHAALFAEYGANLVAPHHPDRFYTARLRDVAYIDQSYQSAPGVTAEIEAAYHKLAPPG